MEEFLSIDEGECFNEFCTSGAVYVVLGSCIRWFVFSFIGIICSITK